MIHVSISVRIGVSAVCASRSRQLRCFGVGEVSEVKLPLQQLAVQVKLGYMFLGP